MPPKRLDQRVKEASGVRDIETEATLCAVGPEAESIIQAIASFTSLEGFRLVARSCERLHDIYWDLPGDRLSDKRMALRLRMIGKETLITFKGPPRPSSARSVQRLEIESPWSANSLAKVIAVLKKEQVAPPNTYLADPPGDSSETMRLLGFRIVQDRETQRRPRDVSQESASLTAVIAELAIDTTVYHVNKTAIRHHEVEIEAKAAGGELAIDTLVDALLRRFGTALRVWNYGKLATGKALAELLRRGDLDRAMAQKGHLTPADYNLIAEFLGSN